MSSEQSQLSAEQETVTTDKKLNDQSFVAVNSNTLTRTSLTHFMPLSSKDNKFDVEGEDSEDSFQAALSQAMIGKSSKANQKEHEESLLNFFDIPAGTRELSVVFLSRLMQLGFSGSMVPQRLFAKVMDKIAVDQSVQQKLFGSADSQQQQHQGHDLLSKLLWCSEYDDPETRQFAILAVEKLTSNTEGLLNCISKMSLHDPLLATWAAVQVYAKTITQEDESDEHVLQSLESRHPYRANEHVMQLIHVPYANKLLVSFDPRCCTESVSDAVAFYEDAEGTRIARGNGRALTLTFSGSSFKNFEYVGNRLWMKFNSNDSQQAWGYKFDVKVSTLVLILFDLLL